MTTYTAISAGEIDADSPITADLMSKLRDNPIAISEGSTGAPKVLANALNITSNSLTGSIGAGAGVVLTIGAYAFFPSIQLQSGGSADWGTTGTTADDGKLNLSNSTGSSISYTVRWRSIS